MQQVQDFTPRSRPRIPLVPLFGGTGTASAVQTTTFTGGIVIAAEVDELTLNELAELAVREAAIDAGDYVGFDELVTAAEE
jgi:hypothetical protein